MNANYEYAKYQFAKMAFVDCLRYLDAFEEIHKAGLDSVEYLERSLAKSYVVTYSRSFTNSKSTDGPGLGMISDSFVKDLPDDLKVLHSRLIGRARNSFVAHVDVSRLRPTIHVTGDQENTIVFGLDLPMFAWEKTDRFRQLAEVARDFCKEKMATIEDRLEDDQFTVG